MRVTLISAKEVVQYSPIDSKFPAAELATHISRVERKAARQVLGVALYQALLKDRKPDGSFQTLSYQRLWNDHLRAYIAYQVALAHVTYTAMKYTAQGVQITETEFSKAASRTELAAYQSAMQSDIEDMRVELEHYLLDGKYKLSSIVETGEPVRKKRRSSPFVIPKSPHHEAAPPIVSQPDPDTTPQGTITDGMDDTITDGMGDLITDGEEDETAQATQELPFRWLSPTATGAAWTFSFDGLLRPQNIDLLAAYDAQGNDITNLVTSYQINEKTGVVDVILVQSSTGRVELVSG